MVDRLKNRWKKLTLNEKLMYGLVVVLAVGIVLRWGSLSGEMAAAFRRIFTR